MSKTAITAILDHRRPGPDNILLYSVFSGACVLYRVVVPVTHRVAGTRSCSGVVHGVCCRHAPQPSALRSASLLVHRILLAGHSTGSDAAGDVTPPAASLVSMYQISPNSPLSDHLWPASLVFCLFRSLYSMVWDSHKPPEAHHHRPWWLLSRKRNENEQRQVRFMRNFTIP